MEETRYTHVSASRGTIRSLTESLLKMILNDNEATKRLSSPKNLALRFNRAAVIPRATRNNSFPPFLKNVIGQLAIEGVPTKEIKKEFDIGSRQINRYKNGEGGVDRGKIQRASEKALDRLMKSLDLLDDEKLEKCNARDLSGIGANMSRIVDRLHPREDASRTLVIYAPPQKTEKHYEVIDI